MPDEIKRPKKRREGIDKGQSPSEPAPSARGKLVQPAKPKSAPKPDAGERSKRRAIKQVGRTIRAGSATTVEYSRKAKDMFDAFTHSTETTLPDGVGPFKAIANFFSKMTFPAFILMSLLVVALLLMTFSNSSVAVDHQRISVVGLPAELEGYTIMLLSDLHAREFGNEQNPLLRVINEQSYNMVVFAGDMVGASGNTKPFYDLLKGMPANKPKYFIAGDSDPSPIVSEPQSGPTLEKMVLSDWARGAQELGAKYLSYTQPITVGNQRLWLSPQSMLNINLTETLKLYEEQIEIENDGVINNIASDRTNLPLTSYRYNTMLLTQQASTHMLGTDIHIALTHMPPSQSFLQTSQQRGEEGTTAYLPTVDLVLSGHYCGGGWRLPGIGALYIPNSLYPRHGWFPAQQDVQGLKTIGLSTQYTTAGLGVSDKILVPSFRLLNAPQVSLITLTAKITNEMIGD